MRDTREGAAAGEPAGTVYLIHLDPPYKHARHYTGWSANLEHRLEEHRAGVGARLLEVAQKAGGSWHLVRTWPGTRDLERAIKDMRAGPELCPECSPHPFPLTRGRAARLLEGRADPAPQPPPRQATPATERQASPAPELVPVPNPRAPVPSVSDALEFDARPPGQKSLNSCSDADGLTWTPGKVGVCLRTVEIRLQFFSDVDEVDERQDPRPRRSTDERSG